MMRILYPENPLHQEQADEPYHKEFRAMDAKGYPCSLFDFDALAFGDFNPHPKIEPHERILYRGWMLNAQAYKTLVTRIKFKGGEPITSLADYLQCHYLSGWYQQCSDFTAKTYFFDADETLETKVGTLGWNRFFVKDFVKSNTAEKGSIAHSPSEVCDIVQQLTAYRGEIEGGVAIRQVEDYIPDTERRYFVVRDTAYSPDGNPPPQLVQDISTMINAPFYSVDLVQNSAGDLRLVELGDGQVSDKKTWPLAKFVDVLAANSAL